MQPVQEHVNMLEIDGLIQRLPEYIKYERWNSYSTVSLPLHPFSKFFSPFFPFVSSLSDSSSVSSLSTANDVTPSIWKPPKLDWLLSPAVAASSAPPPELPDSVGGGVSLEVGVAASDAGVVGFEAGLEFFLTLVLPLESSSPDDELKVISEKVTIKLFFSVCEPYSFCYFLFNDIKKKNNHQFAIYICMT